MNRDGPPGVAGIPRLLSLNVGVPKHVPLHGKTVYTGIFTYPVDGPCMVRKLNIDGDSQGDLNGHGAEVSGDAKILFNKTRTTQGAQTKGRRTTSANSQDSPRTE